MNTIIFAAGGGNDIFSALAHIKSQNIQNVLLVGVLGFTPFHSQNPSDVKEPVATSLMMATEREPILLTPGNINRCILNKKIYCLENIINDVINDLGLVVKVQLMSSKYPAPTTVKHIREHLHTINYTPDNTTIQLVDFGGDILTDGHQDTIISPGLDAFSLAVVRELKEYSSKVIVYFAGCDGELPSDYLTQCCNNAVDTIPVDTSQWYITLTKIFEHLRTVRGVILFLIC